MHYALLAITIVHIQLGNIVLKPENSTPEIRNLKYSGLCSKGVPSLLSFPVAILIPLNERFLMSSAHLCEKGVWVCKYACDFKGRGREVNHFILVPTSAPPVVHSGEQGNVFFEIYLKGFYGFLLWRSRQLSYK